MSVMTENQNFRVIWLSDSVNVHTDIQERHLPALRSGFAGYPMNPRWDALKFRAWKLGRQWRKALDAGEMCVRAKDSLLMSVRDVEASESEASSLDSEDTSLPARSSKWGTRILAWGW
ncbi:MAG: hypothetical protein J7641_07545 [Cyanobacteria bacterium SID2]|nr:hypothetical protein [Cyanobacteria bacterium SID2]MBP0005480.1 hypothetical protein [Cyanobacteria bacterium SBC]